MRSPSAGDHRRIDDGGSTHRRRARFSCLLSATLRTASLRQGAPGEVVRAIAQPVSCGDSARDGCATFWTPHGHQPLTPHAAKGRRLRRPFACLALERPCPESTRCALPAAQAVQPRHRIARCITSRLAPVHASASARTSPAPEPETARRSRRPGYQSSAAFASRSSDLHSMR